MHPMITRARRVALALVCLTTLMLLRHPPEQLAAQQGPTNLLVNGDFESWDWNAPGWPFQDGIPEVQVCPGWRAYYVDQAPPGVTAPEYWKRPEFRDAKTAEFAYRVRSGFLAQKYFTYGGQHIAGLYQQVAGITPGTPLRFSIYMQTWGCMAGEGDWNVCPTGVRSNNPSPMHTRIGIDPYGGTNPWSPNVVWSPELDAYDRWTLFQVDAVAQAGIVTVFTQSYADWFDHVFRIANDVYVDDGSLIALDEIPATATPQPTETPAPTEPSDPDLATATAEPSATPTHTPTPRPDNALVHVVEEGDTLGAIAARYGVTVAELVEINQLDDPNVVEIGQELLLAMPEPTTTPTTPTPTPLTPTPTPTPSPEPTATETLPPPTSTAIPSVTEMPIGATTTPAPSTSSPSQGRSSLLWLAPVLAVGVVGGILIGRRAQR
jgi:LysM repeat protein